MYRQRLAVVRNIIAKTRISSVTQREETDDMVIQSKDQVLCSWCDSEAQAGVLMSGEPACHSHRAEIENEMKVNAGRRISPTKAEKAVRRAGLRRWAEIEADWEQRRTGR